MLTLNNPYLRDPNRTYTPVYVPGEDYSFYLNFDKPITDVNFANFKLNIVSPDGIAVADIAPLQKQIVKGIQYNIYSNFNFPQLSDGQYWFQIFDPVNNIEKCKSNVILVVNQLPTDVTQRLLYWDTENKYNYYYETLPPDFQNIFRLTLSKIDYQFETERTQYRNVSDNRLRNLKNYRNKLFKVESYYFDEQAHEAITAAYDHKNIVLNNIFIAVKTAYTISTNVQKKLTKGEIDVYEAFLYNKEAQLFTYIKTEPFTPDCPAGTVAAAPFNYSQQYTSIVSYNDALQQAARDAANFNIKGQNYANANGICNIQYSTINYQVIEPVDSNGDRRIDINYQRKINGDILQPDITSSATGSFQVPLLKVLETIGYVEVQSAEQYSIIHVQILKNGQPFYDHKEYADAGRVISYPVFIDSTDIYDILIEGYVSDTPITGPPTTAKVKKQFIINHEDPRIIEYTPELQTIFGTDPRLVNIFVWWDNPNSGKQEILDIIPQIDLSGANPRFFFYFNDSITGLIVFS